MPVITARLLGSIELEVDGAPAPRPLRWRKHLALCLLLWHADGRRVPRERAMTMLWGDRTDGEARHSLNEALRVIRRAAGAATVESTGDWIAWHGPLECDTTRFAALEANDPHAAASLVRGDWCDGFAVNDAAGFGQWLDEERRRWRTRLVAALVRASQRAEGRGELAAATDWAERARRLEPLDESALRALLRARFLAGDRTGALTLGQQFIARLEAEMAATPDRETLALLRALASGGHAGRRDPSDALIAREPSVLVGRGEVMGRLSAAAEQARRRGRAALLLVEGEPGSGRTRLLEEVARRATAAGETVLLLRAVPADTGRPGGGLRALAGAAIGRAPGIGAIPPAALATLASDIPSWAEQFAVGPAAVPPLALADAVAAMLRTTAIEQPVLVAVDDADWLDDDSLLAIPELLRTTGALPVVVVATISSTANRPAVDRLRHHLDRDERGALFRLEPLDHQALLEAVAAALPSWPEAAHDRLARRLLAESGGLPALAFQVLAAVVAGMELDDGPWPAADRTYDATLPSELPGTLVAAIRLRFHQLSPVGQQLLIVLSLAPGMVAEEWLAEVLALDPGEVESELDALERSRWLVSDDRGYQFRARTVGALVSAELVPPGLRRRLLGRIASAARG